MFCQEPATKEEREQFLISVKEEYPTCDKVSDEDRDLIARYFASQDMPLCGIKSWFKREYARLLQGNSSLLQRLTTKPKPKTYSCDNRADDPSWRGPNGTWSLD